MRRAENAADNVAILRKFADLSIELATLIVADAREMANAPTTKEQPAKRYDHAKDVDLLFRAARRGALLSDKLLAPPKPEPMARAGRQASPARGISTTNRDKTDCLDRIDQLDRLDSLDDLDERDDEPLEYDPDGEEILRICRKYNITNRYGTPSLFSRPLSELQAIIPQVEEVLRTVMAKFGVISADGIHPEYPPDAVRPPNTS